VRGGYLGRVHIGLDYFDASINRVAAWAIGARSTQRALLHALLEPAETLRAVEAAGDYTQRLALLEALKGMPAGAVWDMFCLRHGTPDGVGLVAAVQAYERRELAGRA
jgi:L-rhamnose isomerase